MSMEKTPGTDGRTGITAPIDDSDDVSDTVLGRYRVVATISSNDISILQTAIDLSSGKTVAIKSLTRTEPEAKRVFSESVQLLAKVSHTNIVQFIEYKEPHYVMNYVGSLSLEKLMLKYKTFKKVSDVSRLLQQLIEPLLVAHSHNIVHGQLNPRNIFFEKVDGQGVVRLVGFGETEVRQIVGQEIDAFKLPYICPEDRDDTYSPSVQSDVYSVGAIAYLALTGRTPAMFFEETLADFVAEFSSLLSAELGNVRMLAVLVRKAVARDVQERYPDLESLQADVEKWKQSTRKAKTISQPVSIPKPQNSSVTPEMPVVSEPEPGLAEPAPSVVLESDVAGAPPTVVPEYDSEVVPPSIVPESNLAEAVPCVVPVTDSSDALESAVTETDSADVPLSAVSECDSEGTPPSVVPETDAFATVPLVVSEPDSFETVPSVVPEADSAEAEVAPSVVSEPEPAQVEEVVGEEQSKTSEQASFVGQIVADRYVILELCSQSDLAMVYLGKNLATDEPVAMKTLRNPDTETVLAFAQEVDQIKALSHPNIVRFIDYQEVENHPFLIMEFVEGLTISELLESIGRVETEEQIAAAISQICEAVEFLQSNSLYFGNLKPESILLLESEGKVLMKVAGFGTGRVRRLLQERDESYVDPRSYANLQHYKRVSASKQAPIYEVGAIAFEMVAGRRPFEAYETESLTLDDADMRLEKLSLLRPDLFEVNALDVLLARALTPVPGQEYECIADLKESVAKWIQSTRDDLNSSLSENSQISLAGIPSRPWVSMKSLREGMTEEEFSDQKIGELKSAQIKGEKTIGMLFTKIVSVKGRRESPLYTIFQLVFLSVAAVLSIFATVRYVQANQEDLRAQYLTMAQSVSSQIPSSRKGVKGAWSADPQRFSYEEDPAYKRWSNNKLVGPARRIDPFGKLVEK